MSEQAITPPANAEEIILKYKRILPRSDMVMLAFSQLTMHTKALVDEPGVNPATVKTFRMTLLLLKRARDKMIQDLTADMMEELMPIVMAAMGVSPELCDSCRAEECASCGGPVAGE